ncbi:purine-cytosine permease [Microthyrium microscopicum]|uniref:Purine-cytosine permease n=1 Tax=Microthyrium microscopicum TaxID=703497 RepID=A0A6A6UEE5_9PEZI|nr:purine-cytosine permease [Microthyrium microscopicum]
MDDKAASPVSHNQYVEDGDAVRGEAFTHVPGVRGKIMRLAAKIGVEQRGIERVPEDERHDNSILNVGTMWLSANMVVSSFAIGLLGQSVFYMGIADSFLTILFFNLIGVLPVCLFSTFGPVFGLRQMVLSRFWFGWWGVKLIGIFNIIACIGWSAVNSIVGAQLINAVNPKVDGAAGIVIIGICTFIVCFFGYRVVHAFEAWAWIPVFIIYLILIGVFAHSGAYRHIEWSTGKAEMGSVLSFGSIIYGFATGWSSYAADYTVYQPRNQNRKLVFISTFLGLIIPILFCEMLGAGIYSATSINGGDNRYADGFATSKVGGLLAAVLFPPLGGFGKFVLVILALSIVANNLPNIYSVSLTAQILGRYAAKVPRFVWTLIASIIYVAIAIPGYSHFEAVLSEFMDMIGYWLAAYEGVALADHFVFKRGTKNYDVSHWDQPNMLPPGIAAIFSFCMGIVGMVLGMSQPWYVGKIALSAGEAPFGGDVGFELAFAFAFTSYCITRPFEKKHFKR